MIFGSGLWSAEESFMLHMRKGGRKEKTSREGPDDLINCIFWKEKELCLRTNAILKNYIGVMKGCTHFLLDAIYMFGAWQTFSE